MKRIHESLRHVFQRNRIVFWYDDTREWGKPFNDFVDEGVKTSYLKLGEALSPIPGLAAAEDE